MEKSNSDDLVIDGGFPDGNINLDGYLYFDFNRSLWFLDGTWFNPAKCGKYRFYFASPNKFSGNYGTGEESVYTNSWSGTRIS